MEKLTKTNYVDLAEDVIKSLITTNRRGEEVILLTTSKIRGILSMVSSIYNDISRETDPKLSSEEIERLQYFKMRLAYEAGREPKNVGTFVKNAALRKQIDFIGDSREQCLIFCKYMESLVAYHKYYGGKD